MQLAATSSSSHNAAEILGRVRRLAVVIFAIALLWPFARPFLAETLVERALGVMVMGDYGTAGVYITRAARIDSDVADVVDASAFLQTFGASTARLKKAQAMLNVYLQGHPNDANARWDRMLLEMRLNEYRAAYVDQQIIARLLPENKEIGKVGDALRTRLARR